MVDKEKTIKGLECCSDMTPQRRYKCLKECPYDFIHNDNCMGDMARDALELLKKDAERITFLECALDFAMAMAKGGKQE